MIGARGKSLGPPLHPVSLSNAGFVEYARGRALTPSWARLWSVRLEKFCSRTQWRRHLRFSEILSISQPASHLHIEESAMLIISSNLSNCESDRNITSWLDELVIPLYPAPIQVVNSFCSFPRDNHERRVGQLGDIPCSENVYGDTLESSCYSFPESGSFSPGLQKLARRKEKR